jgi:taurine--2-oxoglutarate transaminase
MSTLAAQTRAKGLLTFTNFNRLHVVPPCTITEAEAKEGLALLDEVLTEVDAFYEGDQAGR